jgi:NAD(P)H-dependent FMN reductase
MKKIIAFAGSNNPDSINEKLVKSVMQEFPDSGIEFIDLKIFELPLYSQAIEGIGVPEAAKVLFHKMNEATGFIMASPEHNGLPSAFLKNIVDWLSRIDQQFFGNKPIFLMSTSPGSTGGKSHLDLLARLVGRWGGNLMGTYSLGNFHKSYNAEEGTLLEPYRAELKHKIAMFLAGKDDLQKSNVDVVKTYFDAFSEGRTTDVIQLFHPQCYIVSVKEEERNEGALHGIYHGREEVGEFLSNISNMFQTKSFLVKEVCSSGGNLVLARGNFSHLVRSTGKLFNSDWVQLCWIQDGMIKEYRFYEDSAALIAAMENNTPALEL